MRRYNEYMLSLAAAAAALAFVSSCAKDTAPETDPQGEEVEVNFIATTPGVAVKTVLGDETGHRSISWGDKDTVKIFYGTSSSSFKEAPVGPEGEIGIRVQTSAYKNFYAVYPKSLQAALSSTSPATGNVIIPSSQNGKFEDAGIMVAWSGTDRMLRFHTAASILAVDIKDPEVTSFTVRANDGIPIAGQVTFTFDVTSGEITGVNTAKASSSEVTVNVDGAGRYYVSLLPDIDLKAGIGFKICKGTDAEGALSRTPLELKKTELRVIGSVDDKVLTGGDIFIKESGMGKGTSWGDAADAAFLKKLLNAYVSEGIVMDGTTIAWRLAGRKVYIAKGTYSVSSALSPFYIGAGTSCLNIIGGLYEGSTGTDTTKYDPEAYPTVFTAAAGARILDVVGAAGGQTDLKGITFSGASTSTDGAALRIASNDATLNLEDCTFSDNSTSADGAGLYVNGGTVNVNGCLFSSNQATTTIPDSKNEVETLYTVASNGGAVFAEGTSSKLYVMNSRFNGNLAFTGADIEIHNGAEVFVYDCSFTGAVAQASNYYGIYPGRIINADAMKGGKIGKFCACNCTFTKSSSAYTSNGGLPLVAPTNYFCLLASCTLNDGSVALLRNNNYTTRTATDANLVWVINNLFADTNANGNDINLASTSTRHGQYNIMEKGKNSYSTLDETDSKIADADFATMVWHSTEGYYSWTVDEASHPVNKPTRSYVADWVKTACESFDTWLFTISDDPYGKDQTGTQRNPGAMTPGAWDKGL